MSFKLLKYILIVFTSINGVYAQSQNECGTNNKQSWFNILKEKNKNKNNPQRDGQLVIIPYQIHLFKTSNGSSNLTLTEIYNEIDSVNQFYANAGLLFVECLAPDIINNDYYYEFDYDLHEDDVLTQFYTDNVVNIYFANSVTGFSGSLLCGYSVFPPSEDYVVMAANCATNGSTLAHELGHFFGLPHTHGGTPDELVDGSNCYTEGDFICDTPADPILSTNIVNTNCIYTGTATDANGMLYAPDPNNIMSYSRKLCRNYFSPMQYEVIQSTYNDYRNYLLCSLPINNIEKRNNLDIILFPNPGQNNINLTLNNGQMNSSIVFYNNIGSLVYQEFCFEKFKSINTENWSQGIYFYKLINQTGEETNGKWIKN